MGRIRTIKPDLTLDYELAQLGFAARYFFVNLLTHCDKEGRVEDAPRKLHAMILPWDNDVDADVLLDELAPKFLVRYEANGHRYIQVRNFQKHQRPHPKEAASEIPKPTEKQLAIVSREKKRQAVKRLAEGGGLPPGRDTGYLILDTGDGKGVIAAPAGTAKEKTPVQRVVEAYKLAKKVRMDDNGWDKQNFGRYAKAAKSLLEKFAGDVNAAAAYLFVRGLHFDEHGLEWTLETIARNAWDGAGIKAQGDDDGQQSVEVGADRVLGQGRGGGTSSAGSLVGGTLRAIESTAVRAEETPDMDGPLDD